MGSVCCRADSSPDFFSLRRVRITGYKLIDQCLYETKMAAVGFREKRKLAQKADIFVKFEAKERYNNIRQILKKDPSLRNDEELQMMANSQEIVQEIEKRSLRQELAKRRVEEVCHEAV